MTTECSFNVYNASAGSGKTFALVKEYLKILLKSSSQLVFKNILALTFTNKAVAEMKERIIKTLQEFSDDSIDISSSSMLELLSEELNMEPHLLRQKSKDILETIVHNYAAFDISTIDKFNHKLIRTFAYDLKLPMNFEVELDTTNLLSKAVDKLIDKAGTDDALTKILVDFAIEKADEDKSWDVSRDFNMTAKLLIAENDIEHIERLKDKSLDDFKALRSNLNKKITQIQSLIVEKASFVLNFIAECGLEHNDFSGKNGYVPSYFQKLAQGDFDTTFDKVWMEKIDSQPLYAVSSVNKSLIPVIDSIQPEIAAAFHFTKEHVIQWKFLKNVLKNITPLSVLKAIDSSLQELKIEDDLLLISEFNSLISNEINSQPAPYIYERVGERFTHFFIDEFQDTSVLQWKNLVPLIDNGLSGENMKGERGSAMLVGDAKQAIYRWRGGKAEQFIELYQDVNPFSVKKCIHNLPANYRSAKGIVAFNNAFFKHLSTFALTAQEHKDIYEQSRQVETKKFEGYVELTFLNTDHLEEDETKDVLHCQKAKQIIDSVRLKGFEHKDICIITRKSKEGVALAEYLSSENIPVISSESLLLKNSPKVNFIVSILLLASQPDNDQCKIAVLNYLADNLISLDDKHAFFVSLVHLNVERMFSGLSKNEIHFDYQKFIKLPLYEAVETIIRRFRLNGESDAYLQFFMDEVLMYSQKNSDSLSGFVAYWELKKDKLSIASPQGNNAVQIMTIHKSKGLEFPVVIFPFANQNIYFDMSPKTWFPVDENDYNGFSHLYVNQNKALMDLGPTGEDIYQTYRTELELDNLNLLYVVMTRAIEQLYVISELDLHAKQNEKLGMYSGLFINYLKSINRWETEQETYTFGLQERGAFTTSSTQSMVHNQLLSVPKEAHNLTIVTNSGYLWDTAQENAQEKGNLVHDIMAHIKTSRDVDVVLTDFVSQGMLNEDQFQRMKPLINEIVNHQQLANYYGDDVIVLNEKDIITKTGDILRPDRIIINKKNEAVLIDYKTGTVKPSHMRQLSSYESILIEMGYKVTKKLLIYINENIQVKEF